MKFTVEKSDIINEFQSLAAVADKKQTLPILSNILIRCEAEGIKMLSTDLEVELEINMQGANIITPGETTIPAKKILRANFKSTGTRSLNSPKRC